MVPVVWVVALQQIEQSEVTVVGKAVMVSGRRLKVKYACGQIGSPAFNLTIMRQQFLIWRDIAVRLGAKSRYTVRFRNLEQCPPRQRLMNSSMYVPCMPGMRIMRGPVRRHVRHRLIWSRLVRMSPLISTRHQVGLMQSQGVATCQLVSQSLRINTILYFQLMVKVLLNSESQISQEASARMSFSP